MLDFGFYNMDCMEGMKQFPDKYFDLAIVDPPYGDGGGQWSGAERFGERFDRYRHDGGGTSIHYQRKNCRQPDGTWGVANWRRMGEEARSDKKIIAWDVAPKQKYFDELFRVSRNQIIWGGNYFDLPPTRCFLIWRKMTISENFTMAMAEYAWTSFNDNAKVFDYPPQGKGDRFHPTQKPIALYEWILKRYAKEGDTILDTHVGSASSLIACRNTAHQYVGFEIDPDYYRMAKKRLDAAEAQMNLWDFGFNPYQE